MNKRMNLFALTWPIFIENVLFMLLGFIDIFVLSRYNDVAASAVSAANRSFPSATWCSASSPAQLPS